MPKDRPKGADASDARQSRRNELIAVRRGMPEGRGGSGAHPEARTWGKRRYHREGFRRKL
jgi:hypothetical protein